jgi:hypothetical protein
MACESCLELNYTVCDEDLTFEVGLTPLAEYTLTIVNENTDQQYVITITADADGSLVWVAEDQPATLHVPYNGPFTLTISDSDGDPVEFTYAYNEYGCIQYSFIPTAQL